MFSSFFLNASPQCSLRREILKIKFSFVAYRLQKPSDSGCGQLNKYVIWYRQSGKYETKLSSTLSDGAATSATLTSLVPYTDYEVDVQVANTRGLVTATGYHKVRTPEGSE